KSIASVAKDFGIPARTLQRRFKQPLKGKDAKVSKKHLSAAEEKALYAYIDRLDHINLSVRAEFVRDATNTLLAAKLSTSMPHKAIPTVGAQWILDLKRSDTENKGVITGYFNSLHEVIISNRITAANIWNMDETGFRIGLEFLSTIEDVRKKAFKETTIRSAFKKAGIWPLNASQILQEVIDREAQITPSPPPLPDSSDPNTPTTYRQLNKTASKIKEAITSDPNFSPTKAALLGRRTAYTTAIQSRRRSTKNYKLQAGGIMTVIEADERKRHNFAKRAFHAAAKKARYWRGQGLLGPAEIFEKGREKPPPKGGEVERAPVVWGGHEYLQLCDMETISDLGNF
ncbi:hypothetical protein S40288_03373, partial [Stachybotrys chartarum IBT 40288]